MSVANRSLLGSLLFAGAAQLVLVMTIAEARYPGYNMATNYISDLGVGSTALLFNASAVLFGVMLFIGAVSGRRTIGTLLTVTLALSGAGAVGVGLFPETTGALHYICAIVAFGLGAVSAILSYRVTRRPLVVLFSRARCNCTGCPRLVHHSLRSRHRSWWGGARDRVCGLSVGAWVRRLHDRFEVTNYVFLVGLDCYIVVDFQRVQELLSHLNI